MSGPRTLTILLPEHTWEKLERLHEHYLIPPDVYVQRVVIDKVDDLFEAVILDPERKARAANE